MTKNHGFLSSSHFDDTKDPVRGDDKSDDNYHLFFLLFCALRTRKTCARESGPVRGAFYPRGRRLEIIIKKKKKKKKKR